MHISEDFKAQVVPLEKARIDFKAPEWFVVLQQPYLESQANSATRALIKKASNSEDATVDLQREVNIYGLPSVASAVCFRKMYEKIDESTIALEQLDTTLSEVKYHPDIGIYSIIKAFLKAALISYVILEDYKYVNTGRIPGLNQLALANYPRLQTR